METWQVTLTWLIPLLGLIIGIIERKVVWRILNRIAHWLTPQGLVHDRPLIFQIGETAYTAPHPYIDEREVSAIICQVIFGNPNNKGKTVNTFRLEVKSKPPYLLSEARNSERGGSYLVPSGGGFASVPRKPWFSVPLTVTGKSGANGWIGFCLIERHDLTMREAWNMDGELVAIQTDGVELRCPFPVCSLPRTSS